MKSSILGLHHITAIANNTQLTYNFYTRILGLRLVKKTIAFDTPNTFQFYFGNETGAAGTLLAFLFWEHTLATPPRPEHAAEIGYSVPAGSLDFWQQRFEQWGVRHEPLAERFGEPYLVCYDPDGLRLALIVSKTFDPRQPWATAEVSATVAIKGLHTVSLPVASAQPTAELLTDVLGYRLLERVGPRTRYTTEAPAGATLLDLVEVPDLLFEPRTTGSVHHIAFRVRAKAAQQRIRQQLVGRGFQPILLPDRRYFQAISFREPSGMRFEITTEGPGLLIDEPLSALGQHLQLPAPYEHLRPQLEAQLSRLQ
ncbi:MAG: VOC family protein [Janthinobacterium lividum]